MAEKTTSSKKATKASQPQPSTHVHTTALKPTALRGRIFEGTIIKKFPTRVVISFDRTVFVTKYERFFKKRSKIHARVPAGMQLALGDYVRVQECRPLSKIIHAVVIEKVRSAGDKR